MGIGENFQRVFLRRLSIGCSQLFLLNLRKKRKERSLYIKRIKNIKE